MKKRAVSMLLATALTAGTFAFTMGAAHAETGFRIVVEDKNISFDPQPFLQNDRLMVPLRSLAEALGADVSYDPATHTATVKKEDFTLRFDFKAGTVTKNGTPLIMNPAPRIVNGRTMVPLRFFSEAFGNEVQWTPATRQVTVLPTASTLQKRQRIKDILLKSNAATNAKNSYQIDMSVTGQIPADALSVQMQGSLSLDYTKNPFALHGKGSIKATGLSPESVPVEMYITDGVMYFLDPSKKQWLKQPFMTKEEWERFVQLTTSSNSGQQAEQLAAILPYARLNETSDSFQITLSLDQAGIKKMLESPGPQPSAEELQALTAFQKLKYTLTIDKTSFLQRNLSAELEMNSPNGGPLRFSLNANVQKYDQIPPIMIPQEVLQNAIELPATGPMVQ